MKKIICVILLIIGLLTINVKAANYEFRELIPTGIKTTIVTNNFSYKDFYYDGIGNIKFNKIKNLSKEGIPISITVAFFDENKKNMGIMNFCSNDDMLKSKEEKEYTIKVDSSNVAKGKSIKDIKYISILTDNINCNTGRSFDYVGKYVEEIGMGSTTTLDEETTRLLKILTVLGIVLISIFLYKFLFTKSFQNFNGDDVRKGYKNYNKELKEEREEELRKNPPKKKEKPKIKSDEVLAQEEKAKTEDKSSTDLHNLYK